MDMGVAMENWAGTWAGWLGDLAFGLALGWSAAGLGALARRAWGDGGRVVGGGRRGWSEVLGLDLPLGLGLTGLGAGLLALAGCWTWWGWRLFAAVLLIAGVWGWLGIGRGGGLGGAGLGRDWGDGAFLGLASVLLASGLATGAAPVSDGDALCYHLQVPKTMRWAGGAVYEPDLHETVYPLTIESIYGLALEFRGAEACRFAHGLFALGLGGAASGLAGGGRRGRWAGLIACAAPGVSNGAWAPLNDAGLACLGTAAIWAWTRARWPSDGRGSGSGVWLTTGALAGLAAGAKYPGLVLVGLLGLGTLGCVSGVRAGFSYGFSAVSAGGMWYARAWRHTGNPVYPFFKDWFGGSGLAEVLDPSWRPLARDPWSLGTALWPMTLDVERFESVSHQFGPLFLMTLPAFALLALAGRRGGGGPPRGLSWGVLMGYAFFTICLTQRQSPRFLLTAAGPFAAAAAWTIGRWWRGPGSGGRWRAAGRLAAALAVSALGLEAGIAAVRARAVRPLLTGAEDRRAYLERVEPTAVVGRWMGANLPAGARVVGQDHRGFWLPRPYAMELAHRRRTGLGSRGESGAEVVAALRSRGFTHLLTCPPEPEDAVEFDPTLTRLLEGWLSEREPLYRARLLDGDGVARTYRIDALGGD